MHHGHIIGPTEIKKYQMGFKGINKATSGFKHTKSWSPTESLKRPGKGSPEGS